MPERKLHVLVVDDEPAIVDYLRLGLKYEGYEIEAAGDGRSALAAVHARRPDLVCALTTA